MFRFTACAAALLAFCATARASEPAHSAELDDMIVRQAKRHGVPEKLVRRIVMRESRYNPKARNHSFWGLMQISYPTAKSMGFKGSPSELLDPLVNLTYAVPYLANAFVIAGKQEDAAVRLYASGYYATAKSRNLLSDLRTADSRPLAPDDGFVIATARPVANMVSSVVNGPSSAQGAPAVALNTAAPAASAGGPEPEVMMSAGRKGNEPPKKWVKDGGVTIVARGEQQADKVAAFVPPPGTEQDAKKAPRQAASHGRSKKTTEFASLDQPPANAQAYASPMPDPRDAAAQAGPQAAIAQATAGAPEANPSALPPDPAADEKPAKVSRAQARKIAAAKKKDSDKSRLAKADDAGAASTDGDTTDIKKAKPKHHVAAKKTPGAVTLAAKGEEASTAR